MDNFDDVGYWSSAKQCEALAEIESLRQQLASVAKERDEIKAQARMLDRMVDERDEQLAAALAAIERKDDLLVSIAERWNRDENEEAMKDACWYAINAADHARAIKPDASILKAHDEALIERCAEVCEEYQGSAETCAAAIRELKSQL